MDDRAYDTGAGRITLRGCCAGLVYVPVQMQGQ